MVAFFKKSRNALKASLAGLSFIALSACDPSLLAGALPGGSGAGQTIDPKAPVPVALLLPKSDSAGGPVARSMENAIRLAIADLGSNANIDLRVFDTAGSPAKAAQLAQTAVDNGAKIIIGPLFAEAANAAGNAVADDNIVVLSMSNNASIAGNNVFVMSTTFDVTADRLLSYAKRQGKAKAVIVHQNNVGGQVGRNAFANAAQRNGIQVADTVAYEFNAAESAAAGTRARDAMRATGADTLLITAEAAGSLGLMAGNLPAGNTLGGQYLGLTNWNIPNVLALPSLQGGWFTVPDPGRVSTFRSRYQSTYGSAPHALAPSAYDAMAAIGTLVAAGKRDALTVGGLTRSQGFEGAAGIFRLRPNGTTERGLAIGRVTNNSLVVIDPAPRSFGGS